MKILELTLTAREPLVITSGSAESMAHACLDYIPGSMIMGALASAWIYKNSGNPDQSPQFQSLFLNGDVSWGCATPVCGNSQSVPVPLCYMREKSMGGLPVYGQKYDPQKSAVFNPLALPDPKDSDESLADAWKKKYGKGEQAAKFKKLSSVFMDGETLRQPDIQKVWNIRVALGRQRSALEGQLFGFSALAAGMVFRASIFCHTDASVQCLKDLLAGLSSIRVGHARSAGYGLAALEAAWREPDSIDMQTAKALDIYLLSPYMPDPAWENPLDNLAAAIGRLAGQKPELDRSFLAYTQIEGFNNHWKRPRDSRPGLAQGSVIRFVFESPAELPGQLELGSDNLEGYGRILVNPPFLAAVMPQIPDLAAPAPKAPQDKSPDLSAPYWRILRDRAIDRAAQKQVFVWMHAWKDFLDKAEKLSQPTASQRANLLVMDLAGFEEMLKKTPGNQWKEAIAANPFKDNRNEHLDVIVRSLLDRDAFLKKFNLDREPNLPGGSPNAEEIKKLAARSYDLFKRELVRTWAKASRIRQQEGI